MSSMVNFTGSRNTTQNKKKEVSEMVKKIKDVGPIQRRVSPKVIAKTLGAEEVEIKIDTRQSPISLFSLRQFLVDRLRSTGGRPALVGVAKKRRNKIPLFDEDWHKLEALARYCKEKEGIKVSPGQIASALIHTDMAKVDIH